VDGDGGIPQLWSERLVEVVREQYRLDWEGIHGYPHWVRVRENGRRLAGMTGADSTVVQLFALLHDSRRHNDAWDPKHGPRAAAFVESLNSDHFTLSDAQAELLKLACALHADGLTEGDITVQTCWDADRLDLGRIWTRPRAELLCTDAARQPDTIEWAWLRSHSDPERR
jgi:uncharacterized protein